MRPGNLDLRCSKCNKKIGEAKEGNLIELACPRCKEKHLFAVDTIDGSTRSGPWDTGEPRMLKRKEVEHKMPNMIGN